MTDRRYTRLFIDNVSSHADVKELEHMFTSIGPVTSFHASHNSGYVEYENPKDAKYAIKKYDSYRFDGKKLGVEYAVKTSNKHLRSRRSEKERDMAQGRCFNCKERGHLARNCPLLKKGRGSRSRSYSSSSRSRSRDKKHGRQRSKHSRSKSYSSRSYQRSEKSIKRSHSHSKNSKKENGKEKEIEKEKEIKDKSEKRQSKKKESSSRSRSSSSQKS